MFSRDFVNDVLGIESYFSSFLGRVFGPFAHNGVMSFIDKGDGYL